MGRLRDSYILPLLALVPTLSSALDCSRLKDDRQLWDLSPLGGPHSVSNAVSHGGPTIHNTTYTLDICKPLQDSGCKTGTFVCGDVTIIPEEGPSISDGYRHIAGNYIISKGHSLEPKVKRLKSGEIQRDGVQLELHGGQHPFDDKNGEAQMAVIDFICDPSRTGLDNEGDDDDDDDTEPERKQAIKRLEKRIDEGDNNNNTGGNTDDSTSLRFKSYGHEEGTDHDILRLEWLTKYACEDYGHNGRISNHWGFFTWLIVLFFLGSAAYLIFGSWLNYNRYGARGWDMLPHSDTLRDVPYLMKDWARRVVSTIQGPGSRGGYSAV